MVLIHLHQLHQGLWISQTRQVNYQTPLKQVCKQQPAYNRYGQLLPPDYPVHEQMQVYLTPPSGNWTLDQANKYHSSKPMNQPAPLTLQEKSPSARKVTRTKQMTPSDLAQHYLPVRLVTVGPGYLVDQYHSAYLAKKPYTLVGRYRPESQTVELFDHLI